MNSLKPLLLASIVTFLWPVSSHAEWAFIKMLRGEKPNPDFPVQRVAFTGSAVTRETQGTVERLCGIGQWETLKPGARLSPGDVIRTAEGGSVVLQMTESHSFVRLTPMTLLRLMPADALRQPVGTAVAASTH